MADKDDEGIDFKLMEKVLHEIRNEQTLIRNEIREGFASMRKALLCFAVRPYFLRNTPHPHRGRA